MMNFFKEYLSKRKVNSSREIVMIEVVRLDSTIDILNSSAFRNEVLEVLAPDSDYMTEARMFNNRKSDLYRRMCYDIAKENTDGVTYTLEVKTKMLAIFLYCLDYNNGDAGSFVRIKYNSTSRAIRGGDVNYDNVAKVFISL